MAVAPLPAPPKTLTYEEYIAEPRVEGRYDIIDGVRVEMPGASWFHQRIVINLVMLLFAFEKAAKRGRVLTAPFDVIVRTGPLRTQQPDVFFITNERLEEAGGVPVDGPLPLGPELIVEVLSSSESPRTLRAKLDDFASVGVREAWLVSPESETVQVFRLTPERIEAAAVCVYGQTLISEAIAGLTMALADIFDE
jgi:Uma2 family endonuclease